LLYSSRYYYIFGLSYRCDYCFLSFSWPRCWIFSHIKNMAISWSLCVIVINIIRVNKTNWLETYSINVSDSVIYGIFNIGNHLFHCLLVVLWNALDTNNFSFLLFNFSEFIFILLSFLFFILFWITKRYVTLQSHDISHDVTS